MVVDRFTYSNVKRKMERSKLLHPIKHVLSMRRERARRYQETSKSTIKTTEVVMETIARAIFGQYVRVTMSLKKINEEPKRNLPPNERQSVNETQARRSPVGHTSTES